MSELMTPRLLKALEAATWAHRNQYRKGTEIGYSSHVCGVALILARAGAEEDVIIAGLLHDVLEDVPDQLSVEDIRAQFGDRVVGIVQAVSKDSSLGSWQARADDYLARLATAAPIEAVMVSAADKLHNALSILNDYSSQGETVWERFKVGKERQQWWYRSVANIVQDRLGADHVLSLQLGKAVEELETL